MARGYVVKKQRSIYSPGTCLLTVKDNKEGRLYYSLRMDQIEKTKFVMVVKRLLRKHNMTMKDLAEELNMPLGSIYNFMSLRESKQRGFTAAAIANYFKISRKDWMWEDIVEEDIRPNSLHLEAKKTYHQAKKRREYKKRREARLAAEAEAENKQDEVGT